MLYELLARFLIGGTVVSVFALTGDVLKPKSFAGLFGAAPSVAVATLAITAALHTASFAATEAHFMLAGAGAFFLYALSVAWMLSHYKPPVTLAVCALLTVWGTAGLAFALLLGAPG